MIAIDNILSDHEYVDEARKLLSRLSLFTGVLQIRVPYSVITHSEKPN